MHVVLTKIASDDLKCVENSLMVLSKRKKKLRENKEKDQIWFVNSQFIAITLATENQET